MCILRRFGFFLLLLMNGAAWASECQIEGFINAPQELHCQYRDGWYLKNEYEFRCVEGVYRYVLHHHEIEIESGTVEIRTLKSGKEIEIQLDEDMVIRVSHKVGHRYQGGRHYNGWMSEKVYCRI